jgi:hypothetical protein
MDRRSDDPRIAAMARSLAVLERMKAHDVATLMTDVNDLKRQMVENTIVTVQVRDILASFKILGKIAKWVAAMGAAAAALWHGVRFFKGG